ncbi:MAG: 50S ribosomal protein L10 [Candidatus Kapaibacterium sp.]
MTKTKKEEVVAEVAELLKGASGLYSIDFTGLTVANAIRLRREFKKAGVAYKVAKNTLVKRALRDAGGYDHIVDKFVGQTGIAIGYDDPAAPARILNDFIDPKLEIPKLNFAVIEKELMPGSELKAIAAMPSRKDILGSIVGALNAPASGIVGAINAVMRDLASVIEEVAKQKEGASA